MKAMTTCEGLDLKRESHLQAYLGPEAIEGDGSGFLRADGDLFPNFIHRRLGDPSFRDELFDRLVRAAFDQLVGVFLGQSQGQGQICLAFVNSLTCRSRSFALLSAAWRSLPTSSFNDASCALALSNSSLSLALDSFSPMTCLLSASFWPWSRSRSLFAD